MHLKTLIILRIRQKTSYLHNAIDIGNASEVCLHRATDSVIVRFIQACQRLNERFPRRVINRIFAFNHSEGQTLGSVEFV